MWGKIATKDHCDFFSFTGGRGGSRVLFSSEKGGEYFEASRFYALGTLEKTLKSIDSYTYEKRVCVCKILAWAKTWCHVKGTERKRRKKIIIFIFSHFLSGSVVPGVAVLRFCTPWCYTTLLTTSVLKDTRKISIFLIYINRIDSLLYTSQCLKIIV